VRAILLALLLTVALGGFGSSTAWAGGGRNSGASDLLTELWTKILTSPAAGNPFNGGDQCNSLDRGRVLAPFGGGTEPYSCTAPVGTRLLVIAYSAECSTAEDPPFHGWNEPSLRACAARAMKNLSDPSITINGRAAPIGLVRTDLIRGVLPADNLFGKDAGTPITSAGQGWLTVTRPLPPGVYTIDEHVAGTDAYGHPVVGITTTVTITGRGR
jgi:hypothetical protein